MALTDSGIKNTLGFDSLVFLPIIALCEDHRKIVVKAYKLVALVFASEQKIKHDDCQIVTVKFNGEIEKGVSF